MILNIFFKNCEDNSLIKCGTDSLLILLQIEVKFSFPLVILYKIITFILLKYLKIIKSLFKKNNHSSNHFSKNPRRLKECMAYKIKFLYVYQNFPFRQFFSFFFLLFSSLLNNKSNTFNHEQLMPETHNITCYA